MLAGHFISSSSALLKVQVVQRKSELKIKIYKTIIRPIMTFGCEHFNAYKEDWRDVGHIWAPTTEENVWPS